MMETLRGMGDTVIVIMIILGVLIIIGGIIWGILFSLIKKPIITITILFVIVGGVFVFRNSFPFIIVRGITSTIVHSMFPPKDLFKPIIVDKFLFYEKGFTKTYNLKPKYFDNYYLGFFIGGEGITTKYKFKGKLKLEFFYKDKFLFDDVTTSRVSAAYSKNSMAYFSEVDLYGFGIPIDGIYLKDTSVKITVLEPDEELEKFGDLITLFIKVAPSK